MKTWYVHRGGRAIGPVSREQIAAAIVAGKVFGDDLFCEVGGDNWTTGDLVPELRDLWQGDDMVATAERILADSGAVPLDFDDLEPITGSHLPSVPPAGRPVLGQAPRPKLGQGSVPPIGLSAETAPQPSLGPVGAPPELPPAPHIDEHAPTELFSRETLPPELSPAPAKPRRGPNPDSTVRVQRSEKVHKWVTAAASLVIVGFAVSLTVYALMTHTDAEVVTADPTPRGSLPVPFDALSIGMTRAALETEFPPSESLARCSFSAVADTAPVSTQQGAHSRCVHVAAVAGITEEERTEIATRIRAAQLDASSAVLERGYVRALAQVRGMSRAGLVEDRVLLEAFGQTGAGLPETVFGVSVQLAEGTFKAMSSRSQQRHVGAMLDDDCASISPERVSEYVQGSLNARRSRCGRRVGSQQPRFAANVVEAAGAFAGMGLLRASGEPDVENPRTLRPLERAAEFDENHAALVVHLANQSEALENFFDGAVVLVAEAGAQTTWSHAIAWFENDRVTRLLLSLRTGDNIERLENFLGPELGHVSSSDPTHVHWDGDGWRARLDHAALALIVEAD